MLSRGIVLCRKILITYRTKIVSVFMKIYKKVSNLLINTRSLRK
jgi:hypothetical protein